MQTLTSNLDTIAAIATAAFPSSVGIIRISGNNALKIAEILTQKDLSSIHHKSITYCKFYIDNEEIDSGLLLYFKAPHSFTSQDVIEIQTHGSPIVLSELLTHIINTKLCKLADRGEFSKRAFLNGKIDLLQAESIIDLIHAKSRLSAKASAKSLSGDFSKYINKIKDKLIYLRMFVESSIDFPDEDIEFIKEAKIIEQANNINNELSSIIKTAQTGSIINDGVSIVIIGSPNAGKSSLINKLANDEIAIVSSVEGTTRDLIKEQILINDIPCNIIDTAGLRNTEDEIEKLGIEKTKSAASKADICIIMIDASKYGDATCNVNYSFELDIDIPTLFVFNKVDLLNDVHNFDLKNAKKDNPYGDLHNALASKNIKTETCHVSIKDNMGIAELKNSIVNLISGYDANESGKFSARQRHVQILEHTKCYIQEAIQSTNALELFAENLRLAHDELSKITGQFTNEDLLTQIFSNFCIGK